MANWAWSSGGYDSGTAASTDDEEDDDPFSSSSSSSSSSSIDFSNFDSGTAAKPSKKTSLRSSVFGSSFDAGSAATPSTTDKKDKKNKKKSSSSSRSRGIGGWVSRRVDGARKNATRLSSGSGVLESYARENDEKIEHYRQQQEQADNNVDRFFNATAVGVDVATDNPYFSVQDTGKEALRSVAAHNSGLDRDEISDDMLAGAAERSWEENVASRAGGALNRLTGTTQQSSVEVAGHEVTRADALEFTLGAPTRALSKTTTGMDVQSGDQSALTGDEAVDAIASVAGGGLTRSGVTGAARLTRFGARQGADALSSSGARSASSAGTEPLESGIGSLVSKGAREGAESVSNSGLSTRISESISRLTGRQGAETATQATPTRSLPEDINTSAARLDDSSARFVDEPSVSPRSETLPDRITDALPGSTGRQDLDMIRADNGGGIPARASIDELPGDATELRRMLDEGFDAASSRFSRVTDDVDSLSSAHRADNATTLSKGADGVFRAGGRQADEAASAGARGADEAAETVGPTAREAADGVRNAAARTADKLSEVASRATGRNLSRSQTLGISALGLGGLGYIASELFEFGDVDPQAASEMPQKVELADGYFIQMVKAYPEQTGGAQFSVHEPTGQTLGYAVVLRVDPESGAVHILRGSADSSRGPRPTRSRASARALEQADQRGAQAAQRARELEAQQ